MSATPPSEEPYVLPEVMLIESDSESDGEEFTGFNIQRETSSDDDPSSDDEFTDETEITARLMAWTERIGEVYYGKCEHCDASITAITFKLKCVTFPELENGFECRCATCFDLPIQDPANVPVN